MTTRSLCVPAEWPLACKTSSPTTNSRQLEPLQKHQNTGTLKREGYEDSEHWSLKVAQMYLYE